MRLGRDITKQEILMEKRRHKDLNGKTKKLLIVVNCFTFFVDICIKEYFK